MRHKQKELKVESRKLNIKSLGVATLLAFTFSLFTATAQESVNTAGGNALDNGGNVSYSVGQITYQTHTGTNGSVAEGVQQTFEISVVSEIEEAKDINLIISAYPNPAKESLTLEIQNLELSTLSFQLYDVLGRLLQNKKITDNQTNIDMSNLVPATYFVKVIQSNKEVKSFKIIKK